MLDIRINREIKNVILAWSLVVCSIGGSILYSSYENNTQICEEYSTVTDSDIFMDEDGNYCKSFDVGEHHIRNSRNDLLPHTYDSIPGYTIDKVKSNNLLRNTVVEYTNTEPVIAVGTVKNVTANGNIISDNTLEFNNFGKIDQYVKSK